MPRRDLRPAQIEAVEGERSDERGGEEEGEGEGGVVQVAPRLPSSALLDGRKGTRAHQYPSNPPAGHFFPPNTAQTATPPHTTAHTASATATFLAHARASRQVVSRRTWERRDLRGFEREEGAWEVHGSSSSEEASDLAPSESREDEESAASRSCDGERRRRLLFRRFSRSFRLARPPSSVVCPCIAASNLGSTIRLICGG